jgi:hypothetical protein
VPLAKALEILKESRHSGRVVERRPEELLVLTSGDLLQALRTSKDPELSVGSLQPSSIDKASIAWCGRSRWPIPA